MGRTMPTDCPHGVTVDWGDFGPCQDCDEHPGEECPNLESCPRCDKHRGLRFTISAQRRYAIAAAVLGMSEDDLRRRLLWAERVAELDRMTYPECGRLVFGAAWNKYSPEDMAAADAVDLVCQWLTRPEDDR